MIDENHRILLSSILDCVYCKRRYYLHGIEHQDDKNIYMELGSEAHEGTDLYKIHYEDGIYTVTNMTVYSDKYDLYGICDVVEFIESDDGVDIDFLNIRAKIRPVEYKHGKVRHCNEYIAQVVAQVLCLEEMFRCKIDSASIYFTDADEYFDFDVSKTYRQLVYDVIDFIKSYNFEVISPKYGRKCNGCSMKDICKPKQYKIDKLYDELWEWSDV